MDKRKLIFDDCENGKTSWNIDTDSLCEMKRQHSATEKVMPNKEVFLNYRDTLPVHKYGQFDDTASPRSLVSPPVCQDLVDIRSEEDPISKKIIHSSINSIN